MKDATEYCGMLGMFLDVSGCFWMFLDVSGCFWIFLDINNAPPNCRDFGRQCVASFRLPQGFSGDVHSLTHVFNEHVRMHVWRCYGNESREHETITSRRLTPARC